MSYNVNMPFVQFAANLFIAEDPSFGNYDKETTHDLLKSIDINFSKYLTALLHTRLTALNVVKFHRITLFF